MEKFLGRWMPVNASEHGPELDGISAAVHWLMLVLFVGWGLYYVYVLYRFNAKRNPRASYQGVQSHASSYIEAGVAVLEVVLLVGFSIPLWHRWTSRPPRAANPLELRIVGEQFAWNIHYAGEDGRFGRTDVKLVSSSNPLGIDPSDPAAADDIATINELHLEVGRPVVVRVSSKDVIHSFKVPVFRVTQDATPGMDTPIHFKPVKTNDGATWEIACAQLCGLGHYRMRGAITVHNKSDYRKWLQTVERVGATLSE